MNHAAITQALAYTLPECPNARLALFAMRRMGAQGLSDARAAHALFATFNGAFRRPLLMLRALMADLAAASAHPISIAPCCCARMTHAEAALLSIVARAESAPAAAHLLLSDLLGVDRADGVLASAAAVSAAFADQGRPIGR